MLLHKKYLIFINLILINILFSNKSVFSQNWKPISVDIKFQIKHFGVIAEGTFGGFNGTIFFDPMNISMASIKTSIDVKTLKTNIKLRDNALKGKDYFDIEKYPRIYLNSTKIEKRIGDNEYFGYFNVTIKSVTKNIKVPFTFTKNEELGVFNGSFSINREDFKVGEKSLILGSIVNINISVLTHQ